MNFPNLAFEGHQKILDVGGWFKPEPRATHVIDLMPWETRGAKLNLQPLPEEKFSKETWYQMDFLRKPLRFPFDDKSFDIVICGHTIEDLKAPQGILREMQRIAKRGIIECPSRLTEQTKGILDRECKLPGHPHHHWIVESTDKELLLYSKTKSELHSKSRLIPLSLAEGLMHAGTASDIMTHEWNDTLDYRIISDTECRDAATTYAAALQISMATRQYDRILRCARRIRSRLRGNRPEDLRWWHDIVEASQPYTSIPLK